MAQRAARRKSAEVEVTNNNPAGEDVTTETDEKSRAGQPTFDTTFVDELPDNDKKRGGAGRGPSHEYEKALNNIRDNGNGSWGSVATFQTATGAATALRNIKAGMKIVPDDVDKFEFSTRRLTDENGKRLSVLWARYTG